MLTFISAMTPHMGGLREVAVRSMKLQLKKVIGIHVIIQEQFITIVTNVEGILHSRLLVPLGLDNNATPSALTPGNFLWEDHSWLYQAKRISQDLSGTCTGGTSLRGSFPSSGEARVQVTSRAFSPGQSG